MSLYAEYRQERGESTVLEKENGFASYEIVGKECYIQDIYVRKEFRQTRLASEMADEIAELAKGQGCDHLTGSVVVGSKDDTRSLKVLLAYGMQLYLVNGSIIYLKKDI